MNKIITLAFVAILVFYGYHRWLPKRHPQTLGNATEERAQARESPRAQGDAGNGVRPDPAASAQGSAEVFTCQGKTRCTEMKSCEEAKFYLTHCPNVKIDGDGNGIPCEKQWCGH